MQGSPEANALTLLLKGPGRRGVASDGPCGELVALALQLVLQALSEEPTLQAAANRLGVGRRTIYRLRALPVVREHLARFSEGRDSPDS